MDESEVKRLEQDSEVRRVLLAAADLLERDGWCQGITKDDQGKRCIGGAVLDLAHFSFGAIDRRLTEYLKMPFVTWNDTPGRTLTEVLAALRGAAGS